jgi:outer membrane protein assembly factor BamE (lipoprotein component of BamABCDE complex)
MLNSASRRTPVASLAAFLRPGLLLGLALLGATSGCVTKNTTTGEMVPRGKQRYEWEKVKELAKQLKDGMSKDQVLMLMGSPAEVDKEKDQWVYLPERYGILIPAQALLLQFKDRILIEHSYRAIVLGAQL